MKSTRLTTPRVTVSPDQWRFLGLASVWSVALFALLRSRWFTSVAVPFVGLQANIAAWYGGRSNTPVAVTLDCSGADIMALSAAVVLAYPVSWRRRLQGLVLMLPVLLALNIVRIGTLSRLAGSPNLFRVLHLYVWPTVLVAAAGALMFAWMWHAGAPRGRLARAARIAFYSLASFAVVVPWLMTSPAVTAVGEAIVAGSAAAIQTLGGRAYASGATLQTTRGAFMVTPECLLSPVIPLWVAAVLWWPLSRWQRALGLALTVPVMALLAMARLLVLSAPASWIAAPIVFVHGFHQLVLFVAVVLIVALHGAPNRTAAFRRAAIGLAASAVGAIACGALYNRALILGAILIAAVAPHTQTTLRPAEDVQGALAMLPVYQVALFGAILWTFGRRVRPLGLVLAGAALAFSQLVLLVAIGETAAHAGYRPHALVLRAWAAAWPIALALFTLTRRERRPADDTAARTYRTFWDHVGAEFPDLGGAPSTEVYAKAERRLFAAYAGPLEGRRVLKTDLWDEARNTRILQWVQRQGAHVTGIDISSAVVTLARREFGAAPHLVAGADVRALPFADRTFDVIYSMGTVEHFPETEQALRECFRVLKPGGRAIVGVPNRRDPFLRPLLVALLYRGGWYGYGYEKSYSRGRLRRLVEDAGFTVVAEDGLLFVPGWLRMADLLAHTRFPRLVWLTRPWIALFGWIEARVPAAARHGYLITAICERPSHPRYLATGREWMVDAAGCDPSRLRSQATLESLFREIVRGVGLHAVSAPVWHVFQGEGGVTGVQLLSESHLACHTYPEAGYAAFSLYSCRSDQPAWPWAAQLAHALGATRVTVRTVRRGPSAEPRTSSK